MGHGKENQTWLIHEVPVAKVRFRCSRLLAIFYDSKFFLIVDSLLKNYKLQTQTVSLSALMIGVLVSGYSVQW